MGDDREYWTKELWNGSTSTEVWFDVQPHMDGNYVLVSVELWRSVMLQLGWKPVDECPV